MDGMERVASSALNLADKLERENAILRRMVEIAAEYAYCPPVATTKEETMKAFMDQWRERAEKLDEHLRIIFLFNE